MHSLHKGVVLIFALALATCNAVPLCPAATKEQAQQAETALADFAVNLFKNVSIPNQSKNQAMSPVSVALALALLENGADTTTRRQLQDALVGIGSSVDVLTAYRAIQKQLRVDDDKAKLTIANGLFQDQTLTLKDSYVSTTRDCLETQVDNKNDFVNQLEQTRQKINKWISDKTNGKIYELYKKGMLTQAARMVLANAIYFKSSWLTAFNPAQTKHQVFYKQGKDTDTENVPFMRASGTYRVSSTNDLDALELAFQHPDLALYVVLPKARDGLRDLEQRLTGQGLKQILANLRQQSVNLQLPKFVVRSNIDLTAILNKMGLDKMFTNDADFSRMSDTKLKVDKAVHEGYIHVNENGTEAAAATGISIVTTSVLVPPADPINIVADHPFLYAILHKPTNAIVFLGRVTYVETHNDE